MSIVEFNGIKFDLDFEKARLYYDTIEPQSNQASRNFIEYSKQMSAEERELFDLLRVDLSKIEYTEAGGITLSDKLHKRCNIQGEFYCFGKVVEDDYDDDLCSAERGKIEFDLPVYWEPGHCMPEGSLYFYFRCEDIPWLLDERCRFELETVYLSAIKYALLSPYYSVKNAIKTHFENKKATEYIESYFDGNSIEFERMTRKQASEYKKSWIKEFIASTENLKAAYKYCISGKYGKYLWHLFSYELGKESVEGMEETESLYAQSDKSDCVMINAGYMGVPCYRLKNAEKLDLEAVERGFDGMIDVVVTASDFSWAYCFTHERGWIGNYFCKKE